jgi:PilZ domain
MSSPPVQVERRVGQRFPYALAVSVFEPASSVKGVGFTQDLSSRGAFFFTEIPLAEGSQIDLTLQMPSEITLGDSMPVKCRGRVLRVLKPSAPGGLGTDGKKIGVAVRLESYEYLAVQPDFPVAHTRISTSHPDREPGTAQAATTSLHR